ncbi:putative Tat-binding like protein [Glarea lozoyensis 74030]|uniref:Putative Tat-binding like protein n=1 Tax=Glarea lozoyensis (strain ATCC 74030 / MF5533) TaxID=1104152 RepID=H0ETM4_GLAL7|nr:putative Tat-binding like protein [Glarea lozoyensis 74030]
MSLCITQNFDPNKSDSNDTDFDPTETRAPPKKSRKSAGHRKGSSRPAKRARYRGSDVSEDDLDDDDLSVSEESEEEEDFEMNEKTGRRVRKAAKKEVNYEDPSESEVDDLDASDSEEVKVTKTKSPKKRAKPVFDDDNDDDDDDDDEEGKVVTTPSRNRKSKIIKLKINTPALGRSTRAGSALRSAASTRPRRGSTAEPRSAGIPVRRATRATSEALGEEPIALSESGRHVIRQGQSPEPIGRRADRGGKGVKKPASTIKEELHESTSHEEQDEDITMATEVPGTDEREGHNDPDAQEDIEDKQDAVGETEEGAAQPAVVDEDDDEDEDEDIPITRRRGSRPALVVSDLPAEEEADETKAQSAGGSRRLRNRSRKNQSQRKPTDASSDFEPVEESADELSASDPGAKGNKEEDYESGSQRRGRRGVQAKSKSTSRRRSPDSNPEELDEDELAEELYDLKAGSRRRRPRVSEPGIVYEKSTTRTRKPVDYSIKPMDQIYAMDEDGEEAAPTPTRRAKGGRSGASQPWERNLYSTLGPFGGGGGPPAVIGGPWGTGAAGGVDSDSSDDENMARPVGVGGALGMTPTSAMPSGLLPGMGQTNMDPTGALSGTPSALGKVGSRKALADADPLGVDQNVDFTKVGGLDAHIDKLKEMIQMPLLYPELFLKFHIVPPRGVLFYGPPGTGKTLLARALAAQVGSGSRKVTFYMRKGADALSKWVGEAERQLRLLFEEARKTQPSIIFFDEIDGLAPVRSSKQEQIHASIVSTLLALMDGMDGRGQVIVIGATNRPDNIDPALRRPGRFDREFYFPLPDVEARKSIVNINTRDWGLDDQFKNSIAERTKGYGGADLRALCTEAALNAVQRTYPQIYGSNDKLIVNPDKVKITAKDFMISIKNMIPSSERSASSGATPLPKVVEPLLRDELKRLEKFVDELIPIKKKTTALQEAMYEQYDDPDQGFRRETMEQEFERSRVFRPRILICGEPGMGQNYLGAALLNHFEGLHVQNFDLPTIFSDSGRSPEQALVQLFAEVRRHKPSVVYLPNAETWWHTLTLAQTDTFESREAFFSNILEYVRLTPNDFPQPANRKKRKLEVLQIAPPPEVKPPTKEEIKAQLKKDRQLLNLLKIQIQPIMDQIQKKYRKFRTPAILQSQIQYILDEMDPNHVRSDTVGFRPYEIDTDKDGVKGLRETASQKFFYNLETTTIEERLSNGFYARPKDFLHDIRTLAKDAKHMGDKERLLRANELVSNVEVDMMGIEVNPIFADCENVYRRQLQRTKEQEEKERKRAENPFGGAVGSDMPNTEVSEAGQPPLLLSDPVPKRQAVFSTSVHNSRFVNLLNDSPVDDVVSSQISSQGNEYISDSYFIDVLLDRIVAGSSGCSVDQLEQINRELMEGLWEMRGEWNRNVVAAKLAEIFNETIKDIDYMQEVLKASQATQASQAAQLSQGSQLGPLLK